jgi:titin
MTNGGHRAFVVTTLGLLGLVTVFAIIGFMQGPSNETAQVINYGPPQAPSNLYATSTSSPGVILDWRDNSNNEDGFKIERSNDGVAFFQIAIVPANRTTFRDKDLMPNTVYYYRLRAFNRRADSAYSNVASVTTPNVPATPYDLRSNVSSSTQIDLIWQDASSDEFIFSIERSSDGSHFFKIASTSQNTTEYKDKLVLPNNSYWYRVRAGNSGGYSDYSNVANTNTSGSLNAPTNLSGYATSASSSILFWQDNSFGEQWFKVERGTDGISFNQIGTTTANIRTFSDTKLQSGTLYYYRARASAGGNNSDYSNVVAIGTP